MVDFFFFIIILLGKRLKQGTTAEEEEEWMKMYKHKIEGMKNKSLEIK